MCSASCFRCSGCSECDELQVYQSHSASSWQCDGSCVSACVERPGRKADHTPATVAEVKNEWNCTSTSLHLFMACTRLYRWLPKRSHKFSGLQEVRESGQLFVNVTLGCRIHMPSVGPSWSTAQYSRVTVRAS